MRVKKSNKTFVDKVKTDKYRLGDVYSSKNNTFYVITAVEYHSNSFSWYYSNKDGSHNKGNYRIEVTRISKKLRSQGNKITYWASEFDENLKPLTEGQKLLYLQEEIKNV